ncbi:hypothetical protein CBR_g49301 [Chara braunii]|uniref:DDE Tnp4 domain-containing protein n=1 Tax=Chara braunii TaxID=69332 RepID=A0A388M4L4_CHABU|nr:hypothetical protein CBR_g49301 [Chara braunii]|eukprot:GBG89510.1 hypothetical protein CBR_g49301 [Chara braunii]
MSSEAASGMDVDGGAGRGSLMTAERTAIAAVVNAVLFRCQMAINNANFKAAVCARRKLLALPTIGQCLDVAAISDAVLEVCYAMGCGGFPRATPRWWVKRRTGGTWEDLRQCLQKAVVLRAFADKGFPNYHGCIDCTHIYIDKPANANGEDYCDRRRRFSMQAQVVVDMNLHVLDVFVGYSGSVHDMRMLNLSSLWVRAESGQLFTGPHVMLPFGVRTNGYLIGDNGYPQSEWIVVPYGGLAQHLTETRFDNKQKTVRGAVERAFGRLKGMWRLFLGTHKCNMDSLPQQFIAVCILHNILIDVGIPFNDNLLWEVGPDGVRRRVDLGMHQPLRPVCMESSTGDALILRDVLAERMIAQ